MPEPRPYVPPDSRPPVPVPEREQIRVQRKPWMERRDGESKEEHAHRVAHSCYRCGLYLVDLTELGRHEDQCTGPAPDDDDAARWAP